MSSSQAFETSSQLSPGGARRRKSRFTYKHLSQLSLFSTSCPLRVIAHIDLDAFYAQCEMVRLNVADDQPLAVQQWSGLIAINYPARAFGVRRFTTIQEAKKLCPNIIMQHVATWKEGDEKWEYHKDAFGHMGTHKVSLDPYRLQSRKILACTKEALPAPPIQKVEKASIDEFFLDLSAQIHLILLERYPELSGPPPYDDPTELLPRPPTTALSWDTDALVDLDETETEDDDPDWDDIAMCIGSEIVRSVRASIHEHLKYTCSAGVARNKMLAKLGSAHRKPNQQTIVRNRAIQQFLSSFKFTKIRNLGGKLGEQIVSLFATEEVRELLEVPIEQLKLKLGDDTGSWVYQIIRGEEASEVNSRTQIKSMLSAKSFRPSINDLEQGVRWLRIFVADIFSRLVEEGVLENKRRPRTINLHHRQGGQMRSRQAPIPTGRSIDEALLFDLARNLLGQVIVDGRAWPCANLQLSVGGFEDGPTGNRGIGGFLIRGDEAKAMMPIIRNSDHQGVETEDGRAEKRRKTADSGLQKFLQKTESNYEDHDDEFDAGFPRSPQMDAAGHDHDALDQTNNIDQHREDKADKTVASPLHRSTNTILARQQSENKTETLHQASLIAYLCTQCNKRISTSEEAEHRDWHFAKDLQAEERATMKPCPNTMAVDAITNHEANGKTQSSKLQGAPKKSSDGGSVSIAHSKKVEKGQSRLAFGN
ncbi:DNA-directed DNA polymerase eta rad30 [Bachmanniomyces sp. S44760]|nr:DNA-directed DNA polymerase eta rad30 [Bachmanniomyces sp. S44760]